MDQNSFELAEGQVFVHRNHNRKGREPEFWGKTVIDGKEYRISLWSKKSKSSGNTFLKGTVWLFKSQKPEFKIEK